MDTEQHGTGKNILVGQIGEITICLIPGLNFLMTLFTQH